MSSLTAKKSRGRPPKYQPLLEEMLVGEMLSVYQGPSLSYARNLAWKLRSGRMIDNPDRFTILVGKAEPGGYEVSVWRSR